MKPIRSHWLFSLLALGILTFSGAVAAQDSDTLNPAARESIQLGQAAAAEALNTYVSHYPDQPLWQEAIKYGREAVRQAPGRPEPLRFLADVYTITQWYGPAWETWLAYLEVGGRLDEDAQARVAKTGIELGFTNYQQRQFEVALGYYQRVIDLVPQNDQAYRWVGRILLETGRPAQAIPYWQTVVQRNPNDDGAQYFLELTRAQAQWGVEAANAFYEGVELYNQGKLSAASERFARATSTNAQYTEAWAWLGRSEFEQGNYQDAETYYGRASQLAPENDTYQYFYEESQRRQAG